MSGCPPIRAKKARYFQDRRFAERILPPPKLGRMLDPVRPDDWSSLPLRRPPAALIAEIDKTEDAANSGLRREPELPDHLAMVKETPVSPPTREFDVTDETDDSVLQARVLSADAPCCPAGRTRSGRRPRALRWLDASPDERLLPA
jgi:type IV secretion system protein VirD4